MKILATLFLLLRFNCVYSQCSDDYYCLTFDDTTCEYHIAIDLAAFPNTIWQKEFTQKPVLDSTVCLTTVMITDSINPYPVNNHSVFTITNIATPADVFGFRTFAGDYYVQTDSLNDYGIIELSLDHGLTWIDIKDPAYSANFVWWTQQPVFTGRSITCKHFEVDLTNLPTIHSFLVGDTMLFRFSFFSDNIYDTLGGLLFDNICFGGFVEGISEIHFTSIKSVVYPNPSLNTFTIEFDNPDLEPFELAVYDMHSIRILTHEGIKEIKIALNTSSFNPGMYVYKLTNVEAKKRCWGRFISNK